MSPAEKATEKPANPAPEGTKENRDVVLADGPEGKTFEIPTSVAQQYASSDTHNQGEDDEVGGRDRRWLPGLQRYGYHSNWAVGSYIWITDGRAYHGPHWHPNVNSPFAYDMDNY